MDITRRGLLKWLGLGAVVAALPALPEQASALRLPTGEPSWLDRDGILVEAVWFDGRTFFVAPDDGYVWSRDGVTWRWTQHGDMSPVYKNGQLDGFVGHP